MLRAFVLLICLGLLLTAAAVRAASPYGSVQPEDAALKETSFTLGPFHLDRQYPSMTGPDKREKVTLGAGETGSQIWVKAMRLDIRNGQGGVEPVDYLCHAWLAMDRPGDQSVPQKTKGTVTTRGRNYYLEDSMNFTLSGSHREIRLPPGYAIPVERRDLNATVIAMALNNKDGSLEKDLYYTMTVQYMDDAAARQYGIKPLKILSTFIPTIDVAPELAVLPGDSICFSDAHSAMTGRIANTAVFPVPPGRHEFRTVLEKTGVFEKGGTIHYMGTHMHAFGESMAFFDKTENRVLWTGQVNRRRTANATPAPDGWYASAEGIAIDPAHVYELVGVYNNTTGKTIPDAMAMLRVYYSE